jgi:hypothetical protein
MTKNLLPLLTAFLLLAPGARAAPGTGDGAPPAATPAAASKAEAPPIFDPEADGELSLKARFEICGRSNRRLIVFFGTNDCGVCRVVNDAVYEKRFYDELIKQFVPEFIDVAPGTSNAEIPVRYGIDPKAPLPGVVIFDPKHRVTEVLAKGEMAAVAAKGKEAVQLWILERFDRSKPD